MSTPTPIATASTAVASPAADVTTVSRAAVAPAEGSTGSVTSITVPPEASQGVSELIKELERKRLELEAQIKQLRSESGNASPVTPSPVAATASSSPGISSSSQRCALIPTPTSSLTSLPKLPADVKNLIGLDLDTHDLAHLHEQGRVFRTLCTPEMLERRVVTQELLPHVFKACPKKVAEFFKNAVAQKKMVLTKTCYREGYFSKQLNQFVCFRRWRCVSPLQAAAVSLDNFLVRDLLSQIENDATFRLEAAKQLQEVLNRKVVTARTEVGSVRYVSGTVASSSSLEEETKVKADTYDQEKAEVEFADLSVYQAPFKELLKAYHDYNTQCDALYSEKKYDILEKLWGLVAECQRRLPRYGLKEFCDKGKPFDPVPTFTTSPRRTKCRTFDSELDLDFLGFGLNPLWKSYALFKEPRSGVVRDGGVVLLENRDTFSLLADAVAINHLCELRQAELENIINCLLKPGAAITLRANESAIAIKL